MNVSLSDVWIGSGHSRVTTFLKAQLTICFICVKKKKNTVDPKTAAPWGPNTGAGPPAHPKPNIRPTLRVALAKPRGEREGAVAFSDNSLFWEKVSLPPNHSPWKSHTASTAVYPTSTYCWAGDRVHGCHSGGQTAYSEVTIPFLVCAPIPVKSTTQLHYTTQMYLIRTFHGNRSTDQNRCWYLSMFMRPSLAWRRCCLRAHAPASCL
jgi:hypothetical protein